MDAFTETTIAGWVLLIGTLAAWYLVHLHWKHQAQTMADHKSSTKKD